MNEYEQISNWLKDYTPIGNWLYFNVIIMENGSSSLQSVPGNTITKEYIDGSTERQLIFAISMVKLYDAEQSTNNMDAIEEVNELSAWIESQTTLPDFGENCTVHDIEILDHVPNLSIDQDSNTCNYFFQCGVNYCKYKS